MLIFSNGTIYFDNAISGTDIDANGYPITGSDFVLSAKCFIDVQNENRSGKYEEGTYPNGSFVVSLDYDSVDEDFNPKKVRLEHERKGDLGVFTIQRIEFYNLTRTIQIWI